MPDTPRGVAGRTVLVAGATSASGAAACRVLAGAGARVIAVGRDPEKLAALVVGVASAAGGSGPNLAPPSVQDTRTGDGPAPRVLATRQGELRVEVCDLSDERGVGALAERLREDGIRVDGILHLVGGWRGGGGLAGQSDADYRFLERGLTALRYVSRAFDSDLRASESGRLAIVSSAAVARPLAGGANYAAVKAASEAWARAVAQGFAKAARDAQEPLRAASVVFRVTALAGLEEALAAHFAGLWDTDAPSVNDSVLTLDQA